MELRDIVKKSQQELKEKLILKLNSIGYKTHTKEGFTYAKGTVPVMLVAHLDTVHKNPVKTICCSPDGKIMMSPEGIGGDDRAGVYMILQIIKKHRCHVLFCEDEEKGGIGAKKFTQSNIFPKINYIIEFDRRGSNDAVFYDCDNPEFTNFVCEFGFKEAFGSFSDISIIAPHLGVAAVNISAGYYNEHTLHEYINITEMERNIELVSKMVSTKTEMFEYVEYKFSHSDWFDSEYYKNILTSYNKMRYEELMFIPESAFILRKGELTQNGVFLINKYGKVYEYLDDIGVAVEIEGAQALSEHGTQLQYNKKKTVKIEIIQLEDAYNMYGIERDEYFRM